jgi:glycosyltransferase involved in cell wall biosynthesis
MKILMVIDSIVKGGRERRMLELVKALTRPGQDYSIYLVSLTNVVEYDYVHQLPIKLEIIERKSKKDLSVVFKLRKIIKTFEPDVIHSWGSMSSVYLSMVNLFTRNSSFINSTIADAYSWNVFNRLYLRTKLTAPFSRVILANSQAGLKNYKVPLRKAVCIYNGIDLSRFRNLVPADQMERKLLGGPKGNSFIGAMVGAFEDRKDYDTLIKAAVKLCLFNRRAVFFLIGEGSLMKSIKQQVPGELLNSQIYFLGSRSDIESILQIVDVGLLITPCEGISNSIMEYMASGKPVIASREGGTQELVVDGETGFLVDQKRSDQIVEKMDLLMKNPGLAKAMGQNGLQRIKKHFDISKMTERYIEVYNKYGRWSERPVKEAQPTPYFLKSTN